jgi:hypothetical protein
MGLGRGAPRQQRGGQAGDSVDHRPPDLAHEGPRAAAATGGDPIDERDGNRRETAKPVRAGAEGGPGIARTLDPGPGRPGLSRAGDRAEPDEQARGAVDRQPREPRAAAPVACAGRQHRTAGPAVCPAGDQAARARPQLHKGDKLPETLQRIRQRLDAVFEDAIFHKRCTVNPAAAVRRKMREAQDKRERGEFRALPYKEAPAFMLALRDAEGVSARCLELHGAVRSPDGEALLADLGRVRPRRRDLGGAGRR